MHSYKTAIGSASMLYAKTFYGCLNAWEDNKKLFLHDKVRWGLSPFMFLLTLCRAVLSASNRWEGFVYTVLGLSYDTYTELWKKGTDELKRKDWQPDDEVF